MALLNVASRLSNIFFNRAAAAVLPRFSSTSVVVTKEEKDKASNVINTVNTLADSNESRSFAIVHVMGKQRRVTDGDLIVLVGEWPPAIGDEIRLEKVLVAGTKDFSLIGRPLVQPGLVNVTATVIGKTLSHTQTRFRKKRRKQFMRINFERQEQTMLRINNVSIVSNLNQS